MAFAKSQLAAGTRLPQSGTVFLSLADRHKHLGVEAAQILHELGFRIRSPRARPGRWRRSGCRWPR
ncbi:MAG: hypothetical protein R2749_19520 [Acidimicrobiales bacterium]